VCRTILAAILAWDRHERLRPLALGTPEADRLLAGMSEEQRWGSWHIVEPNGSLRSAGEGFAPLLRTLPGGKPLAALAQRSPEGAERAYRLVAGNRSRLGRLVPGALKRRAERAIARREAQ
jgi:predicted DCC family thiol-disulfide oxidoreductase YuxK